MKKIGALLVALVMVLAIGTTAFAVDLEENGEEGVAGNWDNADVERVQADSVNIKKVIKAYNPNGTTVHAPVITYTYTVTPVTVTATVTDETTDHKSSTQVVVPVNAGLTEGLLITTKTDTTGTAGTATSASSSLEFTNTSTWTTALAGAENEYDINLNFSNVNFTKSGVYRYQITETVSPDYEKAAMEDGAYDTVYLDVYVDGNFDIYGYVCMKGNDSVTDSTKKINGFVDGSDGDGTDKYYTYDLTLSKDVVNDTYGANNTAFPFTVFFNNPESYTSTFVIDQTAGTGSTGLNSSAATLTLAEGSVALSGVALVKDGNATEGTTAGDITIKGIPAGIDVDVYETNIANGVTYTVATSVTGGDAVTDNNVSWGTTPSSANAQGSSKKDYESTKATVNTTKIATTAAQSVAITNTLLLISPTGVVLRIAPYALMLAAGIVLVILAKTRRKAAVEEE